MLLAAADRAHGQVASSLWSKWAALLDVARRAGGGIVPTVRRGSGQGGHARD